MRGGPGPEMRGIQKQVMTDCIRHLAAAVPAAKGKSLYGGRPRPDDFGVVVARLRLASGRLQMVAPYSYMFMCANVGPRLLNQSLRANATAVPLAGSTCN